MEQKCECIRIWASKNGKDGTIINLLWHIYFDLNDKSVVMKIVDNLKDKGICINTTYHTTKNIGRRKHWQILLFGLFKGETSANSLQMKYRNSVNSWQNTFTISHQFANVFSH